MTFCKILCNDGENAGGGILAKLDDCFPLTNDPSFPFGPAWGELVFLSPAQFFVLSFPVH